MYRNSAFTFLHLTELAKKINFTLLVLLLVFTIDKVAIKFAGIALLYLLNPDFSFRSKLRQLPLFYLLIIGLEVVRFFLLNKDFSTGHSVTVIVGCLFWFMSFLAIFQIRSVLDTERMDVIENTILVFFWVNVAFSLAQLVYSMIDDNAINPYTSNNIRYGTSTGDRITGIFLAPSYINMMVNSFFVFYFSFRKQFLFGFFAILIVVLTTSNFANIILAAVLVLCIIFKNGRSIKLTLAGYFLFFLFFYFFIAPGNLIYLKNSIWAGKKQQNEIIAYQKEVNKPVVDSTSFHKNKNNLPANTQGSEEIAGVNKVKYSAEKIDQLLKDTSVIYNPGPAPPVNLNNRYGKVMAFRETVHYITSGIRPFLFGAGIGSYSSFLAQRMSKLNMNQGSRFFQRLPIYIAPEFKKDHYQIFKTIYSLPLVFHSIKHFPNSFVNQLFGEYGVTGAILFLIFYVLFFTRHFNTLSYGRYLILLLGGFLLFDYLFEYLSVVVIFELFMLIDIQTVKKNN